MAWLNATPSDTKGKRAEKTRIQVRRERGDPIPLPEIAFAYLTEWLFDIGPSYSTGVGECPIGYRDIVAWQEISGVEIMPWEAKIIRQLSSAYLAAQHKSTAHDCPMPYLGTAPDIQDQREMVSRKLKAMFGSLKKAEA